MSKYKIIINKFNKIIKNLDLDDIELLNNVGRKESYLLYIDSFYSGFYYDVNKFNTFRIVNEKQFREIMLDEGEWESMLISFKTLFKEPKHLEIWDFIKITFSLGD